MGSLISITQEIEAIKKWIDILSDWKASKLTVPAYCEAHQLTHSTFYRWKKRQDAGLLILPNLKSEPKQSSFVPVNIQREPNVKSAPTPLKAGKNFSIKLPNGIVLELNEHQLTRALSRFVIELLEVSHVASQ